MQNASKNSGSYKETNKRKAIVSAWLTLDGVFDADTMEQWYFPYHSDDRDDYIRDEILACDALLMGRATYEMLAPYWSALRNNEMGLADKMNSFNWPIAKMLKQTHLTGEQDRRQVDVKFVKQAGFETLGEV